RPPSQATEFNALARRNSHTTVRTGPYTAVREVALTRFDQGREAERFEVGIGESHGESFAPGEMPGSTTAAGHVAQFPQDVDHDTGQVSTILGYPTHKLNQIG